MYRMTAWPLPHLTDSPISALYKQCIIVIGLFSSCQATLATGALRLLPLDDDLIVIEGITSQGNRRFIISATPNSWKFAPETSASDFHHKLGEGDSALSWIARAIQNAYRAGRIEKIPQHIFASTREELLPKPTGIRGMGGKTQRVDIDIFAAWTAVDSILQSPTTTTHLERPITTAEGKVTHHLLITYQEPKKRFILEMWPFPRPFDSRPPESITITQDTISHFDPDGSEPFSSKDRAIEVFRGWMDMWGHR